VTQHKTAALTALFLDYSLKVSDNGSYYVFNVVDSTGEREICRMDEIHRNRCKLLFESLDNGRRIVGPVIKDAKWGYRIDLSAIKDYFGVAESRSPEATHVKVEPQKPARTPKPQTERCQFSLEIEAKDAISAIAEAEGFASLSDWLRATVYRVINAHKGTGNGGAA
jgi:hypothetical protein